MLHALIEYAQREQLAAEPGFKTKLVRWGLLFSKRGKFLGVHNFATEGSKGRSFQYCPDLSQSEMVSAGEGCRPFLVDGLDVVVLLTKDDLAEEKLGAKHAYFIKLLHDAATIVPELKKVAETLAEEAELGKIRAELQSGKAKPNELATIVLEIEGETQILLNESSWHSWWRDFRARLAEERKIKSTPTKRRGAKISSEPSPEEASLMRCFLSGELVEPAVTHGAVSGLSDVGGLPMGDKLTSFDKEAFRSFGLEQGANAAMSAEMATTYQAAFNDLIKHPTRSVRLAGAKVLYWYDGPVSVDPVQLLIEGLESEPLETQSKSTKKKVRGSEIGQREADAQKVLESLQIGQIPPELKRVRYFALTLSANSGRIVIRDWMEGRFEELASNIAQWFHDLAIIERYGSRILESCKLNSILAAPYREIGDAPAATAMALWRCALNKNQSIPPHLIAQTLRRVGIDLIQDEPARHARFALLKAFCNRQPGVPKMKPELNEYENDPAYLCGRIMAILAAIQRVANPDVGAGVIQRYYAAASTTPALVLGRLHKTAMIAHLPKFPAEKKRLANWFEKQLAELYDAMPQSPPTLLSLEQQTLFAMGFYQQQAQRKKSPDNEAETSAT
jgi:CRISPR-associated protein Csd1